MNRRNIFLNRIRQQRQITKKVKTCLKILINSVVNGVLKHFKHTIVVLGTLSLDNSKMLSRFKTSRKSTYYLSDMLSLNAKHVQICLLDNYEQQFISLLQIFNSNRSGKRKC